MNKFNNVSIIIKVKLKYNRNKNFANTVKFNDYNRSKHLDRENQEGERREEKVNSYH
jgi:hypothetical protein